MKRTQFTKPGFTLIELLVVISIIAVLLSVLVPSLSKARRQAQNVICRSNLKQIGMGGILFAHDHDGYGPPAQWDRPRGPDGQQLPSVIAPYLGDAATGQKVMHCPIIPRNLAGQTLGQLGMQDDFQGLASADHYYNSYGINQRLVGMTSQSPGNFDQANADGSPWGRNGIWYSQRGNCKLDSVRKPRGTIFFADSAIYLSDYWIFNKNMINELLFHQENRGRRHDVRKRQEARFQLRAGQMHIVWVDGSISGEPDDIEKMTGTPERPIYQMTGKYWHGN